MSHFATLNDRRHATEQGLNPAEAPAGYYAVLKSKMNQTFNLCAQCDWRKACNDPVTNLLAPGHRCMADGVISRLDGKTYQRADGCGVVFKRLPSK